MSKIKITFVGGTDTATGSNFLIQVGKLNLMVDCGFYQGEVNEDNLNREAFSYNPKDIDAVFITHAHLDHVGKLPKLAHDGFDGVIISTPPTRDIGQLILEDSFNILSREAARERKIPIYDEQDIKQAMSLWKTRDYYKTMVLDSGDPKLGDIKVTFYNSGHILGSALVVFDIGTERIMFTGDLGNSPSPLLKNTDNVEGVTYLITESVYGDRNHEDEKDRVQILKTTILETITRSGVLMIPAFSVERTQELILIFNEMVEHKEIPLVPVFLDSPLAIAVTKIYKKYERNFNENVEQIIKSGDNIFDFAGLTICKTSQESKAIAEVPAPKVIMAGSGMSSGGRIIFHEERYLPGKRNTLLLVGYQAVGTLGRKIQEGMKEVKILGREVQINAQVTTISGFSAHKDSNDIQAWVGKMKGSLKKVFVVLGELKSRTYLAQRLIEKDNLKVKLPYLGESVEIEV